MFKKSFSLCLPVFLCLLMFCPLVSQIHAADMYLNPTAGYAIMGDSTAAGNVMTLKATGNVGIGTTGPGNKLHIEGTTDGAVSIRRPTDGGLDHNFLDFYDGNTPQNRWRIGNRYTGFLIYRNGEAGNQFIIKPGGNVGIGTTGPSYKLDVFSGDLAVRGATGSRWTHVYSAAASQAGVIFGTTDGTTDTDKWYVSNRGDASHKLYFESFTNTVMTMQQDGNVGIGTTGPASKLEVAGTVHSTTGGFKFPDGTIQTTAGGGVVSSQWTTNGTSIYYNTGNVGIGTTGPGAKLDVSASSGNLLNLIQPNASLLKWLSFAYDSASTEYGSFQMQPSAIQFNMNYAAGVQKLILTPTGGTVGIGYANPGTSAALAINGNVGIGTTAPSSPGGWGKVLEISNTATGAGPSLKLTSDSSNWEFGMGGSGSSNPSALFFDNNGANKVVFDDTGNVGIGTTSPDRKLEVAGGNIGLDQDYGLKFHPSTGSSGDYLLSMRSGGNWPVRLSLCSDVGTPRPFEIGYYTSDDITQAWNAKFHVNPISGNVGIGTASPGTKLDIAGNTAINDNKIWFRTANDNNHYLVFENLGTGHSNNGLRIHEYGGFRFSTSQGDKVEILENGNVGIGTASPGSKLDVAGSVKFGSHWGSDHLSIMDVTHSFNNFYSWNAYFDHSTNQYKRIAADISVGMFGIGNSETGGATFFYDQASSGAADSVITTNRAFTISNIGNVGIGTTPTSWAKLDVAGTISVRDDGTGKGSITSEASAIPLRFKARGGDYPDLVVATSGNVGIGTTNPGYKLEVAGSVSGQADLLTLRNTSSAQSDSVAISFMNSNVNTPFSKIRGYVGVTGNNGGAIDFQTRNGSNGTMTTVMTLLDTSNGTGNVGIGTTAPLAKLHIKTVAGNEDDGIIIDAGASGDGWLRWYNNGAIVSAFGIDEGNSRVDFWSNDGSWHHNMSFITNGNVGIGTTDPGSYKLYVSGSAYSTGGWAGSDERWKKNVASLEGSLDKVNQLQGVSYEWKVDEYPDKGFVEGKQVGLVAQEVEKVIPEIVHTNNDGYKSVSYEKLTAVLVEAVKEQQGQIQEQQGQIQEQQGQIEELKRAVARLESEK